MERLETALIVGLLFAVAFVGQAAYRLQREVDERPTSDELNEVHARLLASEEARRHEAEPPRFELAYDQDTPDPKWPGYARLLLTYNGRRRCERLVIEELRGPRWSSVVVNIQRSAQHTDAAGNAKDILNWLEPGETRVFGVEQEAHGKPGEIRLRLTATIDGYEHPPIVESCDVKPPQGDPNVRWLRQ